MHDDDMILGDFAAQKLHAVRAYPVDWIPELVTLVRNSDCDVRAAAIEALTVVDIDANVAVAALVVALNDESPRVRVAAAEALGTYANAAASAIFALDAMAQDDDDSIRGAAHFALDAVRKAMVDRERRTERHAERQGGRRE
jgi:hypothetical protein